MQSFGKFNNYLIKMKENLKGQVWIETVLYTLIGLVLIGLVLAIAMPKINKAKDRLVVEQAIESLNIWGEKINEVTSSSPGNVRVISAFTMKRGEFYINPAEDEISFVLGDLSGPYSEPGVQIELGKVSLLSTEIRGRYSVYLGLNYSSVLNLTYAGAEKMAKFTASSTPY